MAFVRNLWYVAAWSHDVAAGKPLGVTVIGEPVVLYRQRDGSIVALEDRCPHRFGPLSLGRVEGDHLRCMYHGLRFGPDGACVEVPGSPAVPAARLCARTVPVVESSSWIWVWLGDPAKADPAHVPRAFGLEDPDWVYRSGAIDYEADYELLNDNLCDLSHLDFVHETTLGRASGAKWSNDRPRIAAEEDGLRIERWFQNHPLFSRFEHVDTWSSYRYVLPGLFLLTSQAFPVGTAEASSFGPPDAKPVFHRIDQQSVTPIGVGRTRYLWAFGLPRASATPAFVDGVYRVTSTSFEEDKRMIEAQQEIWKRTAPERKPAALPQDQAPAMFRRLIAQRLAEETQ